jgi:hypothetical protein
MSQPESKDKKEKKEEEEPRGLDDEAPVGTIKIISKDKKDFVVEKRNAWISVLVKSTLDQDSSATELPIPGVMSDILEKVIEYMNHHKGTEPPIIPKPLRSKEMKQVCTDAWV